VTRRAHRPGVQINHLIPKEHSMTTDSHSVRFRTISAVIAAVAAVILLAAPVPSASSADDTVTDPSSTIDRNCRPAATTTVDAPVRNVPGRPDGWYDGTAPAPTYRPVVDGGPRIDARYL
jgi:hypothetical protein